MEQVIIRHDNNSIIQSHVGALTDYNPFTMINKLIASDSVGENCDLLPSAAFVSHYIDISIYCLNIAIYPDQPFSMIWPSVTTLLPSLMALSNIFPK